MNNTLTNEHSDTMNMKQLKIRVLNHLSNSLGKMNSNLIKPLKDEGEVGETALERAVEPNVTYQNAQTVNKSNLIPSVPNSPFKRSTSKSTP